ncbi:hypothetical protein MTR_7g095730 [Medicago truncatula]|uniref:Uncharacterized protein n=1 Tax=Medicago truncatula TaxID=3880 RepID=A0A072U3A7_MEDTR|nr:hypothetical protein MTR_7g095730 [Medicago truncatula]
MEFREWVLRDVVRVEIRVHKPKALKQMMDSVLLIDERSIILRKRGVATEDGGRSSSNCMTDEERNIKGCLCFRYNDIFDPGQVCKNKQLKVMLLEEGITDSRGRVVENEDEIWLRE